ncbi:MAG TPA: peptide deformylase [Candidatus Saccharimonadales bacterium]
MDRANIITLPHPNLRHRSTRVRSFGAELGRLCTDMIAVTLDWEKHRKHELGVALAAVQINRLKRIVVIRDDAEHKENEEFITLINPKIIRLEGELVEDFEGCLSVPDIYGLVKRRERVKIWAQDIDGTELRMTANGFLARVLQHEIDHTNGVLFVDHLKDQFDNFYQMNDEGKLEKLDGSKIKKQSHILWD